jgi:SOS response regulatory protein OraA/RecX
VSRRAEEHETVVEVRRRGGSLREIRTSRERRFLVVTSPAVERFFEVGAAISERDLEELSGPSARSAGLELSYRMLSRRDRTEWEIRSALAGEGIEDPTVVGDIVHTLYRQGYLDDRRLAEGFIRYTMRQRPAGPHLLRKKLRNLGVPEDIVESVLHDTFRDVSERGIAVKLAVRRFDPHEERARAVRRIHGFLSRRGFTAAVVNDICAMILRGETRDENG